MALPVTDLSVSMKCVVVLVCALCCVHLAVSCVDIRRPVKTADVPVFDESSAPATSGADTTYIWKYPYNAAVLSSSGSLLGGGMVYNRRWIITAGVNTVILPASELVVRVGSDSAYSGGRSYRVAKVISHPNYSGKEWDWNVGLLELERNVMFGKNVKAAKIAMYAPANGTRAVVTGWGLKQTSQNYSGPANGKSGVSLRYLVTEIFDTTACEKNWSILVSPRTYCGHASESGPCVSDVGNPLIQRGLAVGMYVGGYYCGDGRYPDFYVDLAQYYEWIRDTVKASSRCLELRNAGVIYYKG